MKRNVDSPKITSFKGKCLEDKNRRIQDHYLPIFPSPPHPDNGNRLYLEGNGKLPKLSWINTKKPISLDWRILDDFTVGGRRLCLTRTSYIDLVNHINSTSLIPVARLPRTLDRPLSRSYSVPSNPLFQDLNPVVRTNEERRMYGVPIRSERAPLLPTAHSPVRKHEPTHLKRLLILLAIIGLLGAAYSIYWLVIL